MQGAGPTAEGSKVTNLIPPSAQRVPKHTHHRVQERIRRTTVENIAHSLTSPQSVDDRLAELDKEWDVERTLGLNASLFALSGVLLGKVIDRRWLYLSIGVTAFLAQHALQGWCPPLPVLRRLGFRTRKEIEQERNVLKTIRGDFDLKSEHPDPYRQAEELLTTQEQ
jgi:hypothetical protein